MKRPSIQYCEKYKYASQTLVKYALEAILKVATRVIVLERGNYKDSEFIRIELIIPRKDKEC